LLAYDGTGFRGWAAQRDPSIRTVEGELSAAIERIVNERIELSVAGRTDAGVHARGQVTSFSAMTSLAPERIRDAVNAMLGPELVVRRASDAPAWFDARFSATAREYRYVIATGDVADPFTARYVWHRPGPLHVPSMRRACAALVGEHDFASFCLTPGGGGRRFGISIGSPCDAMEIWSRSRSARTRSCIRWCARSSGPS